MIRRVCLFVCLVRSFVCDACCNFSESKRPIFAKFGQSLPNFIIEFSEVRVKVQGQKRCIDNFPLVIARIIQFSIVLSDYCLQHTYM